MFRLGTNVIWMVLGGHCLETLDNTRSPDPNGTSCELQKPARKNVHSCHYINFGDILMNCLLFQYTSRYHMLESIQTAKKGD